MLRNVCVCVYVFFFIYIYIFNTGLKNVWTKKCRDISKATLADGLY